MSKYDACTRFRIHLKGVVISDYSYEPSHYSCIRSLGEWLSSQGIPGIYGVDTRAITKVIRESGSMLGKLVVQGSTPSVNLEIDDPNHRNLVAEVSRKEKEVFVPVEASKRQVHVLAVDCGMKNNIIRLSSCPHAPFEFNKYSRRQYMQPMTVESQQHDIHDPWPINFARC